MEPFTIDEPVNTAQIQAEKMAADEVRLAVLNSIPAIEMPEKEVLSQFIANQIQNIQSDDQLSVIEFDARLLSKQALRSMPNIDYALHIVEKLLSIFKWNSLKSPQADEEKKANEPVKEEPAYKDSLESDHEEEIEKVDLNQMTDNVEQSLQQKLKRQHSDLAEELKVKIGDDMKQELSSTALSASFIAGICLSDLLHNKDWIEQVFELEDSLPTLDALTASLAQCSFADLHLKSVHSRLLAQALYIQYSLHPIEVSSAALKYVCDTLRDGQVQNQQDANLRALIQFLEKIEDEVLVKNFYKHVPAILQVILLTYRRAQSNKDKEDQEWCIGQREKSLHILYLCFRCVSWADGIDNELVDASLDATFNDWMNVFLEILPSQDQAHIEMKHSALRCLTIVFRDFINYSRDCINLILKPAWQLLNQHLPVFTELLAYNNQAGRQKMRAKHELEYYAEDDFEEAYGTQGMTLQLIELLTTLVQRPNVQEVVRQGVNPLLMTVTSYMLIEWRDEREYLCDSNLFLHDKSQSVYKVRRIKNQCVDLVSSLIEIFGDQTISSILFIVEYLLKPPKVEQQKPLEEGQAQPIDLGNFSYISENPKHIFKRRDAAMLLVGIFVEDIQMYCIRHPELDLLGLLEQFIDIKEQPADEHVHNVLLGRTLWCISSYTESLSANSDRCFHLKQRVIQMSLQVLKDAKQARSVKLIATRSLVRFARKMKKEHLQDEVSQFETVLDDLLKLLNSSGSDKDAMHLPIEAFMTFSKINEQMVSKMAPKITPQLLQTFKSEHSEGSLLGQDLLNLFKQWCNYNECRDIFINTFLPFIVDIISSYYQYTANEDNKHENVLSLASGLQSLDASVGSASTGLSSSAKKSSGHGGYVDSTILQHVLDLLCTLLRKTDAKKHETEFMKIIDVFPQLLNFVRKSEDMFLLLHGTAALKNFIFYGSEQVLTIVNAEEIVDTAKRLLSPSMNEQAAMCLGNLIIQIFHKVQPQIDTDLLFTVVQKIYKTRMPSTLQQLVLIFARLIHNYPEEIVELLSDTSVDSRISLKVLLDKWLLQQALFRGQYTKTVTLTALFKLFTMRDSRIESLMVIGYNPSHSNINSEVNAPFKILSTLLRFLQSECMIKEDDHHVEDRPAKFSRITAGGERLDTVEGYNDLYDEEADPDEGSQFDDSFRYGESDDENAGETSKIEVNMDDLEDEQECLLEYDNATGNVQQNNAAREPRKASPGETGGLNGTDASTKKSTDDGDGQITEPSSSKKDLETCSDTGSTLNFKRNLFAVKESQDKGLADMETGSEVYMSELLAGFDMEDFDEAEEQNEEDLLQLGDSFAQVSDLKDHIIELFEKFILPPYGGMCEKPSQADEENEQERPFKHGKAYVTYCMKQLNEDDYELAKQFLNPIFDKRRALQRSTEDNTKEEMKQQAQ